MKIKVIIYLCFSMLTCMAFAQTNDGWLTQRVGLRDEPQSFEDSWNLVVWHKDGGVVMFNLTELPQITYSGDKVIIESSSIVEYDFQSIKKMTYSFDDANGINDINIHTKIPFTTDGGTITFLPNGEDLNVKFILMNGIVLKDFVVRKGESYTMTLHSSPEKIYMINVNGVTYKIMIR